MRWLLRVGGTAAAAFLLAGCAAFPASVVSVPAVVPAPVEYTKEEQRRMAAELRRCDAPTVRRAMADYYVLRQQLREVRR